MTETPLHIPSLQRTTALLELHQHAGGIDPLFHAFGTAVAQQSGGTFEASERDLLRKLEVSGLKKERQWWYETVCDVTRGTVK
jgi:hypothetical protein